MKFFFHRLFLISCLFLLSSCANVVPLKPRNNEDPGFKPIPFKKKEKKGKKES